MPGSARIRARLAVVGLCAVAAGTATAAGGAETPSKAQALRTANASIAQRERSAALELYAIQSHLARAQTSLSSLSSERARVQRDRAAVILRLRVTRANLHASQRQLALRVHQLYEEQAVDPVAVVLGAQSLDEALMTIDDLNRTALQDKQVAAESSNAATSLNALSRRLTQEDARLAGLEAAARREADALAAARASKQGFLRGLAAQRRLNDAQLAAFARAARDEAAQNASLTAAAAPSTPAPAAPTPAADPGGRTLTVSATGYALPGTTASGVPVGWGVVAVDPGVIPLGTHMTIPGYGEGVAADTGSAVRGNTIDLWFPTVAQALAWGRRTVTITLH